MATEALAISDIDTYYGDSHVLHGVSFSLQPGRLLGLLGRNGAGKTTCMSTIIIASRIPVLPSAWRLPKRCPRPVPT